MAEFPEFPGLLVLLDLHNFSYDTQSYSLIVTYFFVGGFVCIKSLSRGIYRYKSLKQVIYTDKFLINSYEFNSSTPLFPATLSSPPWTFSLLNIQDACTLNKGC